MGFCRLEIAESAWALKQLESLNITDLETSLPRNRHAWHLDNSLQVFHNMNLKVLTMPSSHAVNELSTLASLFIGVCNGPTPPPPPSHLSINSFASHLGQKARYKWVCPWVMNHEPLLFPFPRNATLYLCSPRMPNCYGLSSSLALCWQVWDSYNTKFTHP
jgi:hypothetical protein